MKVTTKVYPGAIKSLSGWQLDATKMTAEQMRTEIIEEQVIPFDEGTLQNVQTFIDTKEAKNGNVKIVHDTPYARRLYHHPEYDFQTTNNPNAKGKWWEHWLNGSKKDRAKDLYKRFYRILSKRYVK